MQAIGQDQDEQSFIIDFSAKKGVFAVPSFVGVLEDVKSNVYAIQPDFNQKDCAIRNACEEFERIAQKFVQSNGEEALLPKRIELSPLVNYLINFFIKVHYNVSMLQFILDRFPDYKLTGKEKLQKELSPVRCSVVDRLSDAFQERWLEENRHFDQVIEVLRVFSHKLVSLREEFNPYAQWEQVHPEHYMLGQFPENFYDSCNESYSHFKEDNKADGAFIITKLDYIAYRMCLSQTLDIGADLYEKIIKELIVFFACCSKAVLNYYSHGTVLDNVEFEKFKKLYSRLMGKEYSSRDCYFFFRGKVDQVLKSFRQLLFEEVGACNRPRHPGDLSSLKYGNQEKGTARVLLVKLQGTFYGELIFLLDRLNLLNDILSCSPNTLPMKDIGLADLYRALELKNVPATGMIALHFLFESLDIQPTLRVEETADKMSIKVPCLANHRFFKWVIIEKSSLVTLMQEPTLKHFERVEESVVRQLNIRVMSSDCYLQMAKIVDYYFTINNPHDSLRIIILNQCIDRLKKGGSKCEQYELFLNNMFDDSPGNSIKDYISSLHNVKPVVAAVRYVQDILPKQNLTQRKYPCFFVNNKSYRSQSLPSLSKKDQEEVFDTLTQFYIYFDTLEKPYLALKKKHPRSFITLGMAQVFKLLQEVFIGEEKDFTCPFRLCTLYLLLESYGCVTKAPVHYGDEDKEVHMLRMAPGGDIKPHSFVPAPILDCFVPDDVTMSNSLIVLAKSLRDQQDGLSSLSDDLLKAHVLMLMAFSKLQTLDADHCEAIKLLGACMQDLCRPVASCHANSFDQISERCSSALKESIGNERLYGYINTLQQRKNKVLQLNGVEQVGDTASNCCLM